MLSNSQIKEYVETGKIRITPYDKNLVTPSAYYVRLGKNILIPESDGIVDMNEKTNPKYTKVDISEAGVILNPGDFILGQTIEQIAMDNDIGVFLDTRSTLARLGISTHQTSMFLRPGQDNHVITLEIYNAGKFQVKLWPGNKVAKLIFFQTSRENEGEFIGNYKDQKEVLGANLSHDPTERGKT